MSDRPRRRSLPGSVLVAAAVAALATMALPGAAQAAKYKPKAKVATSPSKPGAAGGTVAEQPTGTIGAPGDLGGKDCFVVRKRAFVPGTGYLVKRSTFCN